MKPYALLFLSWALPALPLAAQTPPGKVIPPRLADQWSANATNAPFNVQVCRFQQVYDKTVLPKDLVPGKKVIVGIGFRVAIYKSYKAAPLTTELGLYNIPFTNISASSTFKTNRSKATSGYIVFKKKKVNIPQMVPKNPTNSWYTFFPLDKPLPFTGPNLLLEVVNYGAAPGYGGIRVEADANGSGGRGITYGTKCGTHTNKINRASLGGTPYYMPGKTIRIYEQSGPPNAAAINIIGFSPVQTMGITLPLDLTPYGAKGCILYPSFDHFTVTKLDAKGNITFLLPIPNNPFLSNHRFYTQWLNLEPGANPLGVSTTQPMCITIGPVTGNDGAWIYRTTDNNDTTGHLRRGLLLVTKLIY